MTVQKLDTFRKKRNISDYERAAALVAKYGTVGAELQSALGRLTAVPVDIRPVYAVRDRMAGWN